MIWLAVWLVVVGGFDSTIAIAQTAEPSITEQVIANSADPSAQARAAFQNNTYPTTYLSPRPGAQLVSPATTIAMRFASTLATEQLKMVAVTAEGNTTGLHTGQLRLADDQRTLIFMPDEPFAPAEVVTVTVASGSEQAKNDGSTVIEPFTYTFTIAPTPLASAATRSIQEEIAGIDAAPAQIAAAEVISQSSRNWPYLTVPADLPLVTVNLANEAAEDDYLFLSNFTLSSVPGVAYYTMIVDNNGDPIFYQPGSGTDFKRQPNGLLTYYSQADRAFMVMDASYQIVDMIQAGNGYTIDFHELQLLPNGHALFMIYDEQKVNMDDIVPGGVHAARVTGLVIQELDTEDNVVFEWRSWDHIPIIDTIVPITTTTIDYVHGNAIEVDQDGHLLVSSRHLNEITKINRETGDIIWRMGGKKNEFAFLDDPIAPFALQHDIRRQSNGNITLFDNRTQSPSRGIELQLDEVNKSATLVWSYASEPDAHAFIVGNVQRFPSGNTLINWGSTWPTVTEVNAANEKVFEMTLPAPQMSYRVHRYAWQGWPTWPASLVITEDERTALHYSWNGATDVFYYQVYGGRRPDALEIVDLELHTQFEETTDVTDLVDDYCYFQVRPMGRDGRVGVASNVVYAGQTCKQIYLPNIMQNFTQE